jgi:UDP:flavonoid glycosyltransferase YjiC (YdhE family)
MPRALFFPSYRGGGFGHVSRCLVLAEELDQRGWGIAFVLGGPHAARVSEKWPVFQLPPPPIPTRLRDWLRATLGSTQPGPAYIFFSDLNFQAVRDGFHTPQMVQQEVDWELDIVNRFRPHVLISDAWLLTSIVGRRAELPVIQIIRSAAHPASPQLVWWRDIPSQICSPDITPVFNPVLEQWGLPGIRRAEDLLDGDLLLIPSIPELDPLPPDVKRSHYIGPLTQSGQDSAHLPDWLVAVPRDRPIIYITVGGGSNSVRGLRLLPSWKAAFAETDWTVIISTGGRPVPRRWQREGNLQAFAWVPGTAMIARADVVLFHGGYGTMMESIACGKPSITTPFHSEQEGNGRRLEQLGCGRVVKLSRETYQQVETKWRYGTYSFLVQNRYDLTAEELKREVDRLLQDDEYLDNAQSLHSRIMEYRGAERATELMEKYWS